MDHPQDTSPAELRSARALGEHHRDLLAVAFRLLGSVSESEEVVQEAFVRLVEHGDEIDDLRGWLTVVVSRLCIDRLRSADRRRRSPESPDALDERPGPATDPADRVTLDDQVRLALDVVMTQLTPAERVAFVLHDVFGYPFTAIGDIVGRSPQACRQLASRARRTIDPTGPTEEPTAPAPAHRVAEQFVVACSTGDLDGMVALMDPACTSRVDIGVAVGERVDLPGYGTRRHGPPVTGRDAIARITMRFNGPGSSITLLSVPGAGPPSVAGVHDGRVVIFITLTVRDGRIAHADTVLDPGKLRDLDLVLDT